MKILFAYTSFASFVRRDLRILEEEHQVIARCIRHHNPFRLVCDIIQVVRCELLFVWFASFYSLPVLLAAKILGRKVVFVVGGYEAANVPEMNYGSARSKLKRTVLRFMLNRSHRVLSVSAASHNAIIDNLHVTPERLEMIYHGFEDLQQGTSCEKEATVINIGSLDQGTWLLKGIKDFVAVATEMPTIRFLHLGRCSIDVAKMLGRALPDNLTLCGEIPYERLGDYLAGAKVYVQFSRHESFGCSVAEAMLYGCIPIVTNVSALPEVVGDCGIIIKSYEIAEMKWAVAAALSFPESDCQKARQRILTNFSYESRKTKLLEIIRKLQAER